jgi:hypothetical protein
MEYKGEIYGYYTTPIMTDPSDKQWHHFESIYLSPEPRNKKDIFKTYIWKPGKYVSDIKNFKISIYEPKQVQI